MKSSGVLFSLRALCICQSPMVWLLRDRRRPLSPFWNSQKNSWTARRLSSTLKRTDLRDVSINATFLGTFSVSISLYCPSLLLRLLLLGRVMFIRDAVSDMFMFVPEPGSQYINEPGESCVLVFS